MLCSRLLELNKDFSINTPFHLLLFLSFSAGAKLFKNRLKDQAQ